MSPHINRCLNCKTLHFLLFLFKIIASSCIFLAIFQINKSISPLQRNGLADQKAPESNMFPSSCIQAYNNVFLYKSKKILKYMGQH